MNDDTNKFDAILDAGVPSDDKPEQVDRSVDRSTMSQTDDDGSMVPILDDDLVELSPEAIEILEIPNTDLGSSTVPPSRMKKLKHAGHRQKRCCPRPVKFVLRPPGVWWR